MPVPEPDTRLALRQRPERAPVMFQSWRDLLFLHWERDPEEIRATLPQGLQVDTWEGRAFLGVVPFVMRGIRPRFLPALPWISGFPELNLRTYVHDRHGTPGVWFYSLDVSRLAAVAVARTLFHLPYHWARMRVRGSVEDGGFIDYRCRRRTRDVREPCVLRYRPAGNVRRAEPGSLEFFLVERYVLFADTGRRLLSGRVHHEPYPVRDVEVPVRDERLMTWNGFRPSGRAPDHALFSHGVDVSIYAPTYT